MTKSSLLCIIRHGESIWNKQRIFTGSTDVPLTDQGKNDALKAARAIKDIKFDIAFTSVLKRATETMEIILQEIQQKIPVIKIDILNERGYGELQGKKKDEIIKRFGEKQVQLWRRSYDSCPPGGESLKDCQDRIIPYLKTSIFSYLSTRKKVLMIGHGNSLRAIIMYLEQMTPEEVFNFDLELATPHIYYFNVNLNLIRKEIRHINGAHHSVL
ncbi:MAG: 2,3-bisphosphoglycerate-dependent phosphoglycerate mutase [Candidatus Hodarchaeales archaeon]